MVRLKEDEKRDNTVVSCAFQFHYGTIKSKRKGDNRIFISISIPLWYD